MKDPLKKITMIFICVALLPVAFMIYELGLLNKNEKIVKETYQNQLEAILYSINQYSDDLISSWSNRVRFELLNNTADSARQQKFQSALNQTDAIRYVYLSDMKKKSVVFALKGDDRVLLPMKEALDALAVQEHDKLLKLIAYGDAGFRKMEAIEFTEDTKQTPVFFALDNGDYKIGAILLDLPAFILNNLAPKMQSISQDKFVIVAFRTKNDSAVYSTEAFDQSMPRGGRDGVFKGEIQKKDFWILPGYYLGIVLKGASLDTLVKDRANTSLIMLILLTLMLGGGIFFLYRSIRRELQLSKAKSEFVSNVSHEIRTPLSLIGMFAETLETGRATSEEKKQEYYGIISKETARLSKIVTRILNFSQLDANKKSFSFVPLDLNELCQGILGSYFYHFRDKGFLIEFLPGDGLPLIPGDREAVSEAIINLLDNAVKYSRETKHIILQTGTDPQFCFVAVKDSGIGIARNHQDQVFDQFFRAPMGDVHTTQGSGLGLTLVKKIMEAHQGEVSVQSSPGKGSTFRLRFRHKIIRS